MTTMFWVENPYNLNILKFWPTSSSTAAENMNSLTMITIYISMILAISLKSFMILNIGLLVVGIIALIYYFVYYPSEGYNSNIRYPTKQNPFMNVEIIDYNKPPESSDYYRYKNVIPASEKSIKVSEDIEDKFLDGLYQNPSDKIFNRNNSQRQFLSQPVGSVPNEQMEFAQWLYGQEYVCKSGSIWDSTGVKYTADSLACNGFNASEPTNFGRL